MLANVQTNKLGARCVLAVPKLIRACTARRCVTGEHRAYHCQSRHAQPCRIETLEEPGTMPQPARHVFSNVTCVCTGREGAGKCACRVLMQGGWGERDNDAIRLRRWASCVANAVMRVLAVPHRAGTVCLHTPSTTCYGYAAHSKNQTRRLVGGCWLSASY